MEVMAFTEVAATMVGMATTVAVTITAVAIVALEAGWGATTDSAITQAICLTTRLGILSRITPSVGTPTTMVATIHTVTEAEFALGQTSASGGKPRLRAWDS